MGESDSSVGGFALYQFFSCIRGSGNGDLRRTGRKTRRGHLSRRYSLVVEGIDDIEKGGLQSSTD